MGRKPNYKKWISIFEDYKNGMKWNDLVSKHETSKRTISKAIFFFENLDQTEFDEIEDKNLKLILAEKKIDELQQKILNLNNNEYRKEEEKAAFNLIRTQKTIEVLKVMNNPTRLRILMILIAVEEMSLAKISNKLGISKSTVSRHLKALINTGIVKIREEKVRSPRKKQYFSLSRDLLQTTRLSSSKLRKISLEKALEARFLDFKNDQLLIQTFKDFLGDVVKYYEMIGNKMIEYPPRDHNALENMFSTQNLSKYYFWSLTEEEFNIFKWKYFEFFRDLLKELESIPKKSRINHNREYPYFIWHLIFPINKIYEKDLVR